MGPSLATQNLHLLTSKLGGGGSRRDYNTFLFSSLVKLIKHQNMRITSSSLLHPLPFPPYSIMSHPIPSSIKTSKYSFKLLSNGCTIERKNLIRLSNASLEISNDLKKTLKMSINNRVKLEKHTLMNTIYFINSNVNIPFTFTLKTSYYYYFLWVHRRA